MGYNLIINQGRTVLMISHYENNSPPLLNSILGSPLKQDKTLKEARWKSKFRFVGTRQSVKWTGTHSEALSVTRTSGDPWRGLALIQG